MNLSQIQTRILVNGKPIKNYYNPQGQVWVEARDGSSYSIEVKNNSHERVLAVLSVDGMNVIDGKEAVIDGTNGYIINGYSKLVVDGWRISDDSVKEFVFNFNKNESYAVKLGAGKKNLGVIGVALFEEKKIQWSYTTYKNGFNWQDWSRSNPTIDPNPVITCNSMSSNNETRHTYNSRSMDANVDFAAGTGKGKEVDSHVREVSFNTGSLIGTHSFYYDSYNNLRKRGIIKQQSFPKPFKDTRYCPDLP